jgi:hypothetical protein
MVLKLFQILLKHFCQNTFLKLNFLSNVSGSVKYTEKFELTNI